jgi:hypothetical protein
VKKKTVPRRPRPASRDPRRRDPREPRREPPEGDESLARYEDPVDEASADSMVASDPPASSATRVGKPRRRQPSS